MGDGYTTAIPGTKFSSTPSTTSVDLNSQNSVEEIAQFLDELKMSPRPSDPLLETDSAEDPNSATVFNLTTSPLSEDTVRLLKKGFKFVPTPSYNDNSAIEGKSDLDYLASKIRGRCNIMLSNPASNNMNMDSTNKSMVFSSAIKPSKVTRDPSVAGACKKITDLHPTKINCLSSNLDEQLYSALGKMKKDNDVVFKEADKGSGTVVMEKPYYISKITEMLEDQSTYEISTITCTQLTDSVKKFCNKWKDVLTKDETKGIIEHSSDLPTFYGLPKLHKSSSVLDATRRNPNSDVIDCPNPANLKFRPIISCRLCPTTKLCELLNNVLQPFLPKVKHRLQDTFDFLRKCPNPTYEDAFLVTADITSLYTNITTEKGLEAISFYVDRYGDELLPRRFNKDFLLDLFTFCQGNLYFTFNNTVYKQISGTGMGRIYAPAAADLKVGYQEVYVVETIRNQYGETLCQYFQRNYFRYLDDVFMIWARSLPDITEIIGILNSIDPNIKFLAETSEELNRPSGGLPFLDVEAYFKEGKIHFDLYSKETDTFNYLPFSSCHPRHCVRNIPYSLARRIVVIISEQHNVIKQLKLLKRRLLNKGYPEKLIEESINRAKTVSRDEILFNNSNRNNGNQNPLNEEGISPVYYVSTHNPRSKNLFSDIRGITENLNQALPTGKAVKVRPSFRKSASLKDQLMFRKLDQPTVRKCGKDCTFCTYIQTGSSIRLKNGKTVRTNSNFDCGSRNLVYIATCGNCEENYLHRRDRRPTPNKMDRTSTAVQT